ncbi:MAG: porin [Janthinobacterium lividum]
MIALAVAVVLGGTALQAAAQSSVTLYGVVDDTIAYQSSQTTLGSTSGGRSNVKLSQGVAYGNRFGFKGREDLGGGTAVAFQLESGFNLNTGASLYTGSMFGRQAWVGLTNPHYGTVSVGRQYISYFNLLSSYSPNIWLSGFYGAHPGDIDALDVGYRTNNAVMYTSPNWYGVTISATYALAGVPGSINRGSTWSGAVRYQNGPIGMSAGIMRINNSTSGGGVFGAESTTSTGGESGVSALTNGYQWAQGQQRIAVGGGYKFNANWDVSMTYSNVQYIPGRNSGFTDAAIFNTAGAVLHWRATPALNIAGGYAYTRATRANGIKSAAQYQQVSLAEIYSVSKRTNFYATQAFQRANGNTLGTPSATGVQAAQIIATPSIGDGFSSTPSSSRSLIAVGVGITHSF